MNYEETVELEKNVNIKNRADKICKAFKDNVQLRIKDYEGNGRFKIWSDSHNAVFVDVKDDCFEFKCQFLHENYSVKVTPECVFQGISDGYRGIDHLISHSRKVDG